MDPLSISASVLTLLSAAVFAVNALNCTVDRYKGRDKTLRRLQDGLTDLINILKSMEGVAQDESPILALLKGPISRCAQVAKDFEDAMKIFSGKSKTGLMDWARMEFMKGDINEFIETLAGYKSTITIGLGIITMHTTTITRQVVDQYNEVVKDTTFNLELRLQRIDQKMTSLAAWQLDHPGDNGIDLQNERAVTLQCLRICESANSYIESLQDAQPTLQKARTRETAELIREQFEAQLVTRRTLNENQDSLAIAIGRLRTRLESLPNDNSADHDKELLQLQKEMDYSKQCLEICKEASNQVSSSKIHVIGEVIAETDCDQVVVTALADLFDVGVVKAKERSMQLVGSMPADTLRQMSKDRYGSRFGSVESKLASAMPDMVEVTASSLELPKEDQSVRKSRQARETHSETSRDKPSPNEIRKRKTGQDGGER